MGFKVGLDIGKTDHGVFVRDSDGLNITSGPQLLFNFPKIDNARQALDLLSAWITKNGWWSRLGAFYRPNRFVCTTSNCTAGAHGARIAYVPGRVEHRVAELFPGQAKPIRETPKSALGSQQIKMDIR